MARADTDDLPTGETKVKAVQSMFDAIAPRYDLVNRVMTFRMDVGWRRRTLRELGLPHGSTVLDLACGTGDLCRGLREQGLRPVGMDLSFGMLAAATVTTPLVQADALRLPVADEAVDGVTCGFALRNFRELDPFFAELARVGLLVAHDPDRLQSTTVRDEEMRRAIVGTARFRVHANALHAAHDEAEAARGRPPRVIKGDRHETPG